MHTHTVRDSDSYLLRVPDDSSLPRVDDPEVADAINHSIQQWTQGHSLLTGIVHKYIVKYSAQIIRHERAGVVDEIVQRKIIKSWAENEAASYLNKIYDVLTKSAEKDRLLIAYMQVLSQGTLPYRKDAHVWPEQASLLQAGLLRLQGNQIVVSNAVCANVFDMNWIEQQVPGITRSVSVVKLATAEKPDREQSHPLAFLTHQYARFAVAGVGTILLGSTVLSYLKAGNFNRVSAQGSDIVPVALTPGDRTTINTKTIDAETTDTQISETPPDWVQSNAALSEDKARFDQGMVAAVNGQWRDMLQQFCLLPEGSAYFLPAVKQLEQWLDLYSTDIQSALRSLPDNTYSQCQTLYNKASNAVSKP